ncbi:MAG: metal-binding protein [Chlamydiales bacterium]
MSNYRTHTSFNLLIALPIFIAIGYFYLHLGNIPLIAFGTIFSYGTLFLSPDLDLAYQIKRTSIRGLLTLPFRPYSRLFRHRGLSHMPFVGTLTRVVWLSLIILGIFYACSMGHEPFLSFIKAHREIFLYSLAGLVAADLCHLLLDL